MAVPEFAWVVLALGAVAALQYVVYRRLRGTDALDPLEAAWVADPAAADPVRTARPAADGRVCPRCGAVNDDDPVYTRCRACAGPLA